MYFALNNLRRVYPAAVWPRTNFNGEKCATTITNSPKSKYNSDQDIFQTVLTEGNFNVNFLNDSLFIAQRSKYNQFF